MTNKTGLLTGVGPGPYFRVMFRDEKGMWYESILECDSTILDKIEKSLDWIGLGVKVKVDGAKVTNIAKIDDPP